MLLVVFCACGRAEGVQNNDKQNSHSQNPQTPAAHQHLTGQATPPNDEQDIHADVKIVNPPKKDFYDKAPVWISVALLTAAFLTLLAIKRQADLMEEANQTAAGNVAAAKANAGAALLNAQALIASERPWIVIRRRPRGDHDKCEIVGINRGRTPAEVRCISGLIVVQPHDLHEPSKPLEPLPLPRSALTTAQHSFRIQEFSFEWCREKVENEAALGILLAFFEVKYWDMFMDRNETAVIPHLTRMCFTVDPYKRRLHRKATGWTCHT